MANPIAVAAALSRTLTVMCPHCGAKKLVDKTTSPKERACARCHKHFTVDARGKTSKAIVRSKK